LALQSGFAVLSAVAILPLFASVCLDRLAVSDGALDFELSGRCGYESGFAYSSEDA